MAPFESTDHGFLPQDLATTSDVTFGSLQIAEKVLFQYSGSSPHALAEIDAKKDGTNGGDLEFYTKIDAGSMTKKLTIASTGAIGIGADPDYGTLNAGHVLTSRGSDFAPTWTTPLASYTAPYFILNKSSSQTIPDSGGAVDAVDISWDSVFTASPLTAVAFVSGSGETEFKVGVAGMYHLDITAEVGGTGAAKLELNVYIDGVLKVQDIINVYDAQSSTTSGDNVRESTLSCSFLKALTTSNVIKVQARAILIVTGTTMVVVAGSATNRTQVSGFRVGA